MIFWITMILLGFYLDYAVSMNSYDFFVTTKLLVWLYLDHTVLMNYSDFWEIVMFLIMSLFGLRSSTEFLWLLGNYNAFIRIPFGLQSSYEFSWLLGNYYAFNMILFLDCEVLRNSYDFLGSIMLLLGFY